MVSAASPSLIFSIGSPLLDITVPVDLSFISSIGMEPDRATVIPAEELQRQLDLLPKDSVFKYTPGGSALNTARNLQVLLNENNIEGVVTYTGSVGTDKRSDILRNSVERTGLNAILVPTTDAPTGATGVYTNGNSRSMAASLGAAAKLKESALDSDEARAALESSKICYACGFALSDYFPVAYKLAKYAADNNKPFVFNFSSPFMCTAFHENMAKLVAYADIICCNLDELSTFVKVHGLDTSDPFRAVAELPFAEDKKHTARTLIITNGKYDTTFYQEGRQYVFPVNTLPDNQVVDGNGAGDAFVAGFLFTLLTQDHETLKFDYETLEKSINFAHDIAARCIAHVGSSIIDDVRIEM